MNTMTARYVGGGIVATKDDAGRRVRLPLWGGQQPMRGSLVTARRCRNTGRPVAMVLYDGEKYPVATYQEALEWDDELQLAL